MGNTSEYDYPAMGKIAIRGHSKTYGGMACPRKGITMERETYFQALTDVCNVLHAEPETIEWIINELLREKKIDESEYDTLVEAYLPE